jgi:hypothetical protein
MTEDAARISAAMPVRGKAGESPEDASERVRESARTRLLRRARLRLVRPADAEGWSCPDCGLPTRDPVATRLGFCSRCDEFTGMCAAGRRVVFPDVMSMTTWHSPCTNLGVSPWQISQGETKCVALLCPQHDADVKAGRTSFLSEAVPLTSAARFDISLPPT